MFPSSRTNRFALVVVLGALATALPHARASADGAAEPLSPALKAMQGTWIAEENGTIHATWTIDGDSLKATVDGVEYGGKLTLDDRTKPHPSLTAKIETGPSEARGRSFEGIYKLDGEKLVVNIATPGSDRPDTFEAYGNQSHLFELKKEKAGK